VNLETAGGRRFILTVGCGLVCALLVMAHHISDVVFRDIIIATVAAYITGNVWQKVAEIKNPVNAPNEGVNPDADGV
jgi:hypothetical protein